MRRTLVDLGVQPLANSYLGANATDVPEPVFPLHARVCDACLLVQVDRVAPPEAIFNESYVYFSSYSETWLDHCRRYADEMVGRFALGRQSRVVEIGSNDGYLLANFVGRGIPVLGIEPSGQVAAAAIAKGVPTEIAFFGTDSAARLADAGWSADLLAAKNVLAHVPDVNDFVAGVARILQPRGVFTVEFPHLLNLIREVQFDTIYHEHFTYLSLLALERIFARHGLSVFDAEEQPTHGGSLRVFVARAEAGFTVDDSVDRLMAEERAARLDRPEGYEGFGTRVRETRQKLLAFLAAARQEGRSIAAYGAAAKGNTLLNYCGITVADIPFVVDRNRAKQGMRLPGSRIPIRPIEALLEMRPDIVLILPWNLRSEIVAQHEEVFDWGGCFVTAIPTIRVQTGAE